jgi:hypothetical protein
MADTDQDVSSYLFTQNLTATPPPLSSPTAEAPVTAPPPPPPPPDRTADYPRYQSEFPRVMPAPPTPGPLQQYNAPYAPADRYDDPMKAFQNPMVLLAGLGSLFTRRPLTTALNAGAEAMKGYHQGQKDLYEQNHKTFEDNLKAAAEQNRVELARYKDAWDRKREFNWDQVAPKMYEQAARTGDTLMVQALNSHNWDLVEKILLGREKADDAYEATVQKEGARAAARQAEIERWKQDPSVQAAAKAVGDYRIPRPLARSMNNFRDIAIQELVDQGGTYDTGGYAARMKTISDLANSKTGAGARIISLNTAVRHFDTLDRLVDELGSGDNLLVNHAINELRRIRNDPAVTNLEFASEAVAKEIVKSLVPVGAGGTEERQRIADAFSADHSPPALHSLIGLGRELLGSQMQSIKNYAYAGHAGDDFERRIEPATRKALDIATGEQTPTGMPAKIAQARKAGYNDQQIRQNLSVQGYSDDQITQWFGAVK